MSHAVISAYVRSPFTLAYKGGLSRVRPDDMLADVMKALVQKTGVIPDDIEDVLVGCAFPEGEQGLNIARLAVFLAGLPITVAGATVNRFCGSSMQAIHMAAGAIAAGAGEVFIAAGVESMSRVPMVGFTPMPNPVLFSRYPEAYEAMGITAENVARRYDISRKVQEKFALESQQKAVFAANNGYFAEECIMLAGVQEDGCIRSDSTLDAMVSLAPAFEVKGTVTAATSSPLTDGAAAVLVCSENYADAHGLPKMARIVSMAVAGCAPEIMGMGPVAATRKAVERAAIAVADLDIIELNEAFASQALACIQELGLDKQKVNIDGGAIALGHPLGATGARITGKAASLLVREGKRYALATQCIGGGQGIATVLERV